MSQPPELPSLYQLRITLREISPLEMNLEAPPFGRGGKVPPAVGRRSRGCANMVA